MKPIIEEYYAQANLVPFLLQQKFEKLTRNKDVCDAFEYWIVNKKYKADGITIVSVK